MQLHYIFVECQSLLGLANSPQSAEAETKGSSERKFRHASRGKGQRRGCQGKGQGSLFPPFLEGKGQRRGCQGKGQGSLFPPFLAGKAKTTRRGVHCSWDADYYDNEVALAAPGELVEGDLLSALHYFAPSIRGCLNASWRIHSAWSRQELPARCFQMTQDMAYALSVLALHWQ